MDIRNAVRACCALLAAGAAPAHGQAQYSVVDLGTLGGTRTEGLAINAYGQVSGEATLADGRFTAFFWDGTRLRDIGTGGLKSAGVALNDAGQVAVDPCCRWTAGTLESLAVPPAVLAWPADINASGAIAGEMMLANGKHRAMLWTGGAPRDLGTLGGDFSTAHAINDAGQVAGGAEIAGSTARHGVIWTAGVPLDVGVPPGANYLDLERLNASGQAIGNAGGFGIAVPVRWNGTALEVLGRRDAAFALVTALNDRGQTVGALWYDGRTTAALWEPGTTEPVPLSTDVHSYAFDVNAAGTVVGWTGPGSDDVLTAAYAFLWNGRLRHVEDAIDPADPLYGRVRLTFARRVNDASQVLATGYVIGDVGVLRSFVLTPRIPRFEFGGFLRPIDAAPATNVVKAGAAVPVKFSLGGYRGPDVFAPGYPRVTGCDPSNTGAPAATPGNAAPSYDGRTDTYTFVWKTDKAWAGACRRLEVAFVDETPVRAALFQFR